MNCWARMSSRVMVRPSSRRLDRGQLDGPGAGAAEIEEAERAQLMPWTAIAKVHYVRVTPSEITGRHFRFGPEPDPHAASA